jgi:hypothetical protein
MTGGASGALARGTVKCLCFSKGGPFCAGHGSMRRRSRMDRMELEWDMADDAEVEDIVGDIQDLIGIPLLIVE